MRPKTRKFTLYAFTALFFLIGSYLFVLAQGYAIDAKNLKLTKTGGIFLKFSPDDAIIKINNKIYKNSGGLINQGVFIKNLTPGRYKISLLKNGFREWQKNLEVPPGKVAAASQIKLWPEKIAAEKIKENLGDFWLTKNGLISQNKNGKVFFNDKPLITGEVIIDGSKSDFLVIKNGENYFFVDSNNSNSRININELFNSLKQNKLGFPGVVAIKDVYPHPFSQNKIIIATGSALYSLDFKKIELEKIFGSENLSVIALSDNEIFATDSLGKITAINLVLKTKTTLPIKIAEIKLTEINPANTRIFILTKNNDLFLYNRENQTQEKIDGNVKNFYLLEDQKRLVILKNDDSLQVFHLEDYEQDTRELKGTFSQIPLPEKNITDFTKIQDLPNYFLTLANNKLIISEFDSRPPLNSQILETEVKKYILQKKDLYILKTNSELLKTQLEF